MVGFHLLGEVIGTEGMAGRAYPYTARALENSTVCELRLERLPETGRSVTQLQQAVIDLLGAEVAFNHELTAAMVHQGSEQRIAGFLVSLSRRLHRRGAPSLEFNMAMSRSDIGNYLGLAGETVSRTLSRFQKKGLIRVNHKRMTLLDIEVLARVASE
ncbi:MAG: helix-turn-helix domain-containing protein [Candidatus Sedimenticola endophacoides]